MYKHKVRTLGNKAGKKVIYVLKMEMTVGFKSLAQVNREKNKMNGQKLKSMLSWAPQKAKSLGI